jgi:hypothetical protein
VCSVRVENCGGSPKVEELEEDVISDCTAPIVGFGMFLDNGHSKAGVLKLLHGFERCAGAAGRSDPDRRVNFCMEGEVEGTDVST